MKVKGNYVAVSICPPAVRTVVLMAYVAIGDDCNYDELIHVEDGCKVAYCAFPVVAIQTAVTARGEIKISAIAIEPIVGLWTTDDPEDQDYEIVACPWPEEQDADRLPNIARERLLHVALSQREHGN